MEYFLIVGLGNPGSKYQSHRHNIGQMILEEIAGNKKLNWTKKFKGEYCLYKFKDDATAILLRPTTYMNLSGESVVECTQFYKIPTKKILVVHDELDLDVGALIFKNGGGLAGHNGLKSMAQLLSSQDFHRLRVGIGRPPHGDVSHWVLSNFSEEEKEDVKIVISRASEAIDFYLLEGFVKSANKFNRK